MLASRQSLNPFRVLLTHRNFRNFWVGQTLSLIGTWMQSMAAGWLALELSNNAFIVGLVAAAGSFPILLFSLHAGVLIDRSDKLRLVKIAQTLLLFEASVLWWLTWSHHVTVAWLLILSLVRGSINTLEIPARQSMMIDLVGRDDLRDAIALNSSGFNLARIVGPAAGAIVIARLGLAWCFAMNAISYLTVLFGLSLIVLPPWQPPRIFGAPLEEIRQIFSHVASDPPLRGVLELVSVFSVLGIPYIALMPVMARDQFGLDAGGYGLMLTVLGIGGVSGALVLAAVGRRTGRGALLTWSSFGYAALLILLSLTRRPMVAYAVLLGTGFLMIMTNAVANGLLQTLVPDSLRGRLMSLYSLIVVGLPQVLGAFVAGIVARAFSVQWAIGGPAAVMLLFAAVAYRRYPQVRHL